MDTKDLLAHIGSNIKRAREKKNMLQHDLAAICNYEKSNMSRIESGKTNITIGTLNKIAQALGVSVADLVR